MSKSEVNGGSSTSHTQGGERFRDIAEIFESTLSAQCLQARTDAIGNARELGPPDLAFIVKNNTSQGSSSSSKSKEVGSYHFVLGVDTSSSASVAAYVNSLTYSMENSVGWFRSNPWKIARSIYCSYNAFSRVDMRVEARIPGGVTAYAINASGQKITSTAEMWQETFVSAVLRSIFQAGLTLPALRRLDMLPNEIVERRWLEAAGKLFWSGWTLGAADGQSTASNVNNYLAQGLLRFFVNSQKPSTVLELFGDLSRRAPEINSLLAQALLAADQEPEAVRIMHYALNKTSIETAPILAVQSQLLVEKKEHEDAIQVIKSAIKASPMDHSNWVLMAKAFARAGLYADTLLALNTCPITAIPEAEPVKIPGSAKLWVPRKPDAPIDTVGSSTIVASDSVLERLKASGLRGPPAQIYSVLVELVGIVGWDGLLKLRSKVFLMEEEYRNSRTTALSPKESPDDDDGEMKEIPLDDPKLDASPTDGTEIVEKRLCERWLDNLFMILFEDLRIYTIYRGEVAHFENSGTPYQRTPREWLILGSLCQRLGHLDHAKEAYRRCVETCFCREAWMSLLGIYIEEGRLSHALTAAMKIIHYEDAHFSSASFPSDIGESMLRLVRLHGAERIKGTMVSLKMGGAVDTMVQRYIDYAAVHKTLGHDF